MMIKPYFPNKLTRADKLAKKLFEKVESVFVKKDGNKVLSTNDYTTAEKKKLSGIKEGATKTAKSATNGNILIDGAQTVVYTHPDSDAGAKAEGLYKITTDAEGHVTGATEVAKEDITKLGIPGESGATYEDATATTHGLMSAEDKAKAAAVATFLGMKRFRGIIHSDAEMESAYQSEIQIGDWWFVAFDYPSPHCFGSNGFTAGSVIIAIKELAADGRRQSWGDNFGTCARMLNTKEQTTYHSLKSDVPENAVFVPSNGSEGQILKWGASGPKWADA